MTAKFCLLDFFSERWSLLVLLISGSHWGKLYFDYKILIARRVRESIFATETWHFWGGGILAFNKRKFMGKIDTEIEIFRIHKHPPIQLWSHLFADYFKAMFGTNNLNIIL